MTEFSLKLWDLFSLSQCLQYLKSLASPSFWTTIKLVRKLSLVVLNKNYEYGTPQDVEKFEVSLQSLEFLTDLEARINIDDVGSSPLQLTLRHLPLSLRALCLSGNNLTFSEKEVASLENLNSIKFYKAPTPQVQASLSPSLKALTLRSLSQDLLPHLKSLTSLCITIQRGDAVVWDLPLLKELTIYDIWYHFSLKDLPSLRLIALE